ncbi:uncharacterized protein RJT21DRAFT_114997 [Scheffersomyces amazonensis]|uniref:uncharacterized protein n=1 Tax=Scheffersomyces amazonensis TaxID=1078765 RepID=UPI00315D1EDE
MIRPIISRNTPINHLTFKRSFFLNFKWFTSQRLIYPPKPQEFTTDNRIIENYVTNDEELSNIILINQPIVLNFTYATEECNKVTQSLFDILSNREKYPLKDKQIYLVNILADEAGGRELLLKYVVGDKIPALLLLKKQIPIDRYVPELKTFSEQDLIEWIKTID